jgi:hypothetical protein
MPFLSKMMSFMTNMTAILEKFAVFPIRLDRLKGLKGLSRILQNTISLVLLGLRSSLLAENQLLMLAT